MRKGDWFAVGAENRARLLCECRGVKDGVIEGHVINGAWDFTLCDGVVTVLYTKEQYSANIVWKGEYPRGLGDYNDILKYLDRRLNRWGITNWFIDQRIRTGREWERFKRAVGAAKRAYRVVYQANSRFVQDESDTIPF